jgi:hypothetical protein
VEEVEEPNESLSQAVFLSTYVIKPKQKSGSFLKYPGKIETISRLLHAAVAHFFIFSTQLKDFKKTIPQFVSLSS